LKENVILGRKIPVGTGYRDPNAEEFDEDEIEAEATEPVAA
jgi:hypothetical protein